MVFWQQFRLVRPVQRISGWSRYTEFHLGNERNFKQTQMKAKVSANDSVVEGLDKTSGFHPNTYYKFNVTGAGTQNTNLLREIQMDNYTESSNRMVDIHRKWESVLCKGYLYKGGTRIQYIYLFQREEYTEVYGRKRYCTTCEISVQCSSVN